MWRHIVAKPKHFFLKFRIEIKKPLATSQNHVGIVGQLGTSIYLYINGFILLEFLDGQVIWRCAVKGKPTKQWAWYSKNFQIVYTQFQDCLNLYLLVKRKSSKALASSGHIVSNFPDEACWRATGSPIDSTLSRDETASFQVLSDGQAYFKPKGIRKVLRMMEKRKEESNRSWHLNTEKD